MTETTTAAPGKGHNLPEYMIAFEQIDDLYDEAKNWADGEPIDSEQMHDAVTDLYEKISEAGKWADQLRKDEKKPFDDKVKEIQDRYNKYVQPKKGKVDIAKASLQTLLADWRRKVAEEKEAEARRQREEADRKAREAEEAIRASAGNLAAREQAEADLKEAKAADKAARRADKAATTGTGLRSVWTATVRDETVALDWAWERSPERFRELLQQIADEAVRSGARSLPGFDITEERVAR